MEGSHVDVYVQWRGGAAKVRVTKPAGELDPLLVVDLCVAFVERRRQWDNAWDNTDPETLVVLDKEGGIQLDAFSQLQHLQKRRQMGTPEKPLFIVARNMKRRRDEEEETEEDKVKALKELIESEKYDDAWARFAKTVETFKGDGEEADDEKCNPIKVKSTWEGDEDGPKNLTRLLLAQCNHIDTNIDAEVKKEMLRESGEEVEPGEDQADYRAAEWLGSVLAVVVERPTFFWKLQDFFRGQGSI